MASSLRRKLEQKGYLSLNQFVQFLKEEAPEAAISYPTALKLIRADKLHATMIGGINRIRRSEVERWISEGNSVERVSKYSPLVGLHDLGDPD